MKLTQMSQAVLDYVKENGGKVAISELAAALNRSERSIGANVTDLKKKELAVREKVAVDGEEKPVTYVVRTDAGMNFVPSEDEE